MPPFSYVFCIDIFFFGHRNLELFLEFIVPWFSTQHHYFWKVDFFCTFLEAVIFPLVCIMEKYGIFISFSFVYSILPFIMQSFTYNLFKIRLRVSFLLIKSWFYLLHTNFSRIFLHATIVAFPTIFCYMATFFWIFWGPFLWYLNLEFSKTNLTIFPIFNTKSGVF